LEFAQKERDEMPAGPGRGADRERAAQSAGLLAGEILVELVFELEHALGIAVEDEAGLGRLHAPPGAVEQPPSETLLERADLQADRRLRYTEPLGRLGEALLL